MFLRSTHNLSGGPLADHRGEKSARITCPPDRVPRAPAGDFAPCTPIYEWISEETGHTCTVSSLADAIDVLSGDQSRVRTQVAWRLYLQRRLPVLLSRTRIDVSSPPDAMYCPFADHPTAFTGAVWPS